MTSSRVLLCISFFLFVGCGDDSAADVGAVDAISAGDAVGSVDAAGATDAAGSEDATSSTDANMDDATAAADVEEGEDAGAEDAGAMDAAADVFDAGAPDVGSGCETSVEDRIPGVCDGIGMRICSEWASDNGGMNAVAQCIGGAGGRCARANTCTDDRCMCGSEPECGDTEMCVSGVAGFSCVCI